jgi:hypothetical protein
MLSFDLSSFDLPTFDPIPRRRDAAPAAKAKPVKKRAPTVASIPPVAPELVATAADVATLQSELASLRAELQVIKDAPLIEERQRVNARLLLADLAYRNAVK